MTLLLTENSDLVRMVINSMRTDLTSTNDVFVNLALAAVANIGGKEMSESLHQDVYKLLIANTTKPSVKKRAALCLLRLFRKNPESLPAADWADKIVPLIEDSDLVRATGPPDSSALLAARPTHATCKRAVLCARAMQGVGTAVASLVMALAQTYPAEYRTSIQRAIARLTKVSV